MKQKDFNSVAVILPFGLPWQGFGPARNAAEMALYFDYSGRKSVIYIPKDPFDSKPAFCNHTEALGLLDREVEIRYFYPSEFDEVRRELKEFEAVISVSTPLNDNTDSDFRESYMDMWKELTRCDVVTIHLFVEHQPYVFSGKNAHYDLKYVLEFTEASVLSVAMSEMWKSLVNKELGKDTVQILPFDGLDLEFFKKEFWRLTPDVDIERVAFFGRYSRLKNAQKAVKFMKYLAIHGEAKFRLSAEGITGGIWTKEIFYNNPMDKENKVKLDHVLDKRSYKDPTFKRDNAWGSCSTDSLTVFGPWDFKSGLQRIAKTGFTMSMFNLRATSRSKKFVPKPHACIENTAAEAVAVGSILISDGSFPELFLPIKDHPEHEEILTLDSCLWDNLYEFTKSQSAWEEYRDLQYSVLAPVLDSKVVYENILAAVWRLK